VLARLRLAIPTFLVSLCMLIPIETKISSGQPTSFIYNMPVSNNRAESVRATKLMSKDEISNSGSKRLSISR
jgi:hypothetical protein